MVELNHSLVPTSSVELQKVLYREVRKLLHLELEIGLRHGRHSACGGVLLHGDAAHAHSLHIATSLAEKAASASVATAASVATTASIATTASVATTAATTAEVATAEQLVAAAAEAAAEKAAAEACPAKASRQVRRQLRQQPTRVQGGEVGGAEADACTAHPDAA
jgi:hypothetical protein